MIRLARKLWPLNRSLSGKGVDQSLKIIKKEIPINIIKFKSGTKVFDWRIPNIWEINDAWIKDSKDKKILNFKDNNLHGEKNEINFYWLTTYYICCFFIHFCTVIRCYRIAWGNVWW